MGPQTTSDLGVHRVLRSGERDGGTHHQKASRMALTIVRANSVLMRSSALVSCWKNATGSSTVRPPVASYSCLNIRLGFSHNTLFSRVSRSSILALIEIA